MKTFLPLSAAVAFAAFVILPFVAEIAIWILFTAGLALVLSADYGRRLDRGPGRHGGRPSIPNRETTSALSARERLRLAA